MISSLLRIKDHRGVRHRVQYGLSYFSLRRNLDRETYKHVIEDAEIEEFGKPRTTLQRYGIVNIAAVLFVPVVIAFLLISPLSISTAVGVLFIICVLGLGLGLVLRMLATAFRLPELAALMLRHSLCPACSHKLVGLNPEPDGCRVCPECGAAWRIEDAADRSSPGR